MISVPVPHDGFEGVACLVCGDDAPATTHTAREMMFGLGGCFRYRECPACSSLQLLDVPTDLAAFYPRDYYSYATVRRPIWPWLDAYLKRRRARAILGRRDPLGGLLRRCFGETPQLLWLRRMGLDFSSSILDVGCGVGDLLCELQRDGFENLRGVDPFLDDEIDHGGGLLIHKWTLDETEGVWDLIMLHHSLEHMPDPRAVFTELARLVKPGGWLLVRVPVADCRAWSSYGVDWVQLDAPRHLVLYSRRGLTDLATESGFRHEGTHDDSTAFQFWGSELYRRSLPLRTAGEQSGEQRAHFSAVELARWQADAERLNADGVGDQAVFFFRRR